MPRLYYIDGVPYKRCCHCNKAFTPPEKHFPHDRRNTDGFCNACKSCRSEMKAEKRQYVTEDGRRIGSAKHTTRFAKIPHKQTPEQLTYKRQWLKDNPLKTAEYNHDRIAKKYGIAGYVDYQAVLQRHGMWCYICQQPILQHQDPQFEHCIPLSRGGAHSTDNVFLAHGICNKRKDIKLLDELDGYERKGPPP